LHLKTNTEMKINDNLYSFHLTNKIQSKINFINRLDYYKSYKNTNIFFNSTSVKFQHIMGILISLNQNYSFSPTLQYVLNNEYIYILN